MYQFYLNKTTLCNIIKQFLSLNNNFKHTCNYFEIASKAAFKPNLTLGQKHSCSTSTMVTDASSDNFLYRLIRHLKLSLDQLIDYHSPSHAAAVNHVSRQSDTEAKQRTTWLDVRCPVLLTTWAPTPHCTLPVFVTALSRCKCSLILWLKQFQPTRRILQKLLITKNQHIHIIGKRLGQWQQVKYKPNESHTLYLVFRKCLRSFRALKQEDLVQEFFRSTTW